MRFAATTTTSTTTTHYWEIENKDVIVIPSLSFDAHELQNISGIGHYEGEKEGRKGNDESYSNIFEPRPSEGHSSLSPCQSVCFLVKIAKT
jgi:hypothetical protein